MHKLLALGWQHVPELDVGPRGAMPVSGSSTMMAPSHRAALVLVPGLFNDKAEQRRS